MKNLSAYELSAYGANVYQSSAYGQLSAAVAPVGPFGGHATLGTGLKSYYPLSDGTDVHGGNNLTNSGAVTFGAGKNGNCAIFSSTNGVLTAAYNAAFDVGAAGAGLSASAWIRTNTSVAGAVPMLGENTNSNPAWRLQVAQTTGKALALVRASGVLTATSSVTINNSQWHHVVMTYDPADKKVRIYQDGGAAVVSTGTGTQNAPASQLAGFELGGDSSIKFGGYSVAELDEVGLWDRPLTFAEVGALYASGSGLFY